MSPTNTQNANNLIELLEKAKNNDSLDEHHNPKHLFNKMVNMAINDITAYQQFVKDKNERA